MIIFIFIIAHWYLSLFAQTFFHHRYSAHSMFTMSRFWEKFFYVFSFVTQGSSYLSPYAYGILHRLHHAYADTKDDPHSPKYESNLISMMWKTNTIYHRIKTGKHEVEEKFKKNLPHWPWFDRFFGARPFRIFWIAFYIGFYVLFATHWWMFLFIPLHIFIGPIHGAIINWFAHKYGSVRYEQKNTSRNLFPVDILMLGEGYHNNHHKYPKSPNFGKRWYEIDPTYPAIWLMEKMGIIQFQRKPATS